jgi:hypothetical protein
MQVAAFDNLALVRPAAVAPKLESTAPAHEGPRAVGRASVVERWVSRACIAGACDGVVALVAVAATRTAALSPADHLDPLPRVAHHRTVSRHARELVGDSAWAPRRGSAAACRDHRENRGQQHQGDAHDLARHVAVTGWVMSSRWIVIQEGRASLLPAPQRATTYESRLRRPRKGRDRRVDPRCKITALLVRGVPLV